MDRYRLSRRPDGPGPRTFSRGSTAPLAIRWFGSTALLGHLRHLGAEALASNNVDTRDWMRPQAPEALLDAAAAALGAAGAGATLAERLGRDVWIDFVSDTGDDFEVSRAVGRLVFGEYEADDGPPGAPPRRLPRGDLLIFGGDTAYPVSSAVQIARRLIRPWNAILREHEDDGRTRVVLGIPGNHDWYDGLDGFARFFRRPAWVPPAAAHDDDRAGTGRRARAHATYRHLHVDELAGSVDLARDTFAAVSAVLSGRKLRRAPRLALRGYAAVQDASYWALPLAPGLDLWGVDRHLRDVDFRQSVFFRARGARTPGVRRLFVCSDPAVAMGERNEPGQRALQAVGLSLADDPTLFLTGDSHHYERRTIGPSQHVIAGGGGSFVHGTRVHACAPGQEPARAYPDARQSRRLARTVPWHVLAGTAGVLPHLLCALLAVVQLEAFAIGPVTGWVTTAGLGALSVTAMLATMSLKGRRRGAAMAVAVIYGLAMAVLPLVIGWSMSAIAGMRPTQLVTAAVMAVAGPALLGAYLLTLVYTGLDPWTAYSALGHPGYKHFVRLCVRPDGRVEAWVIGKDDPLSKAAPVLIDRFDW